MHQPVLLKEAIEYLKPQAGRYIDGTAGGGGHLMAILTADPQAEVLGIDLDQASLDDLKNKITQSGLGQRCTLVQGNYKDIDKLAAGMNWDKVRGIIIDLGFSSLQLDDPARGFSFQTEGPLDMRFDRTKQRTAADVVNKYPQDALERVIREYGEEKFFRRIASGIVKARQEKIFRTTTDLAEAIKGFLPPFLRFKHQDSARRVFQAVRIEVNQELENLKIFLPKSVDLLEQGGRLAVISFHSLEDRIIKDFFKEQARDCVCPPEFPTCICDKASRLRILTRKPVVAQDEEVALNPRSKPAKLRAVEKI